MAVASAPRGLPDVSITLITIISTTIIAILIITATLVVIILWMARAKAAVKSIMDHEDDFDPQTDDKTQDTPPQLLKHLVDSY